MHPADFVRLRMPAVLLRMAVCAGFTWEPWGNEIQSPYIFRKSILHLLPISMGTEDWWSDGREERVTGTFFLFHRREKTKG